MFTFALLVIVPAVLLAQQNNFDSAVEHLFKAIDINNDKRLVLIETEGYFLAYDANADGNITQPEFSQALDQASSGFRGHEKQVYDIFDLDSTGVVTKDDIDAVFHKADNNSDNHITDQEFHAFLHSVNIIVG